MFMTWPTAGGVTNFNRLLALFIRYYWHCLIQRVKHDLQVSPKYQRPPMPAYANSSATTPART
jgi:hypothetical protein